MRRASFLNLALIFVGVILACVLAELVISLTGLAPQVAMISAGRFRFSRNPAIGYEPVPDYEYHGSQMYYFEFRGKGNSLGFRDREHPVAKPDDTYRLLVIGDSITMGLYIENSEDIYTVVLEQILRSAGHRVEVINCGVSGYNTQQEVAMLIEKGLQFKPDLVLLQYCLNDNFEMDGGIITELRRREEGSGAIDRSLLTPFLVKSALYRFIAYQVFPRLIEQRKRERIEALANLKRDTVAESFGLLKRTADEEGFKVLVLAFPYFRGDPDYIRRKHQRVAELSESNGFYHLDLRQSLAECEEETGKSVALDVCHPSVEGHACVARAVARYLVTNGFAR